MKHFAIILIIFITAISCNKKKPIGFKVPENYRKWKKPTKKILDYPISGHGKGVRIIYANDITYSATTEKNEKGDEKITMPEGSIIIKEIYPKRSDVNKKEPVLTIMVKNNRNAMSMEGWLNFVKKPGKPLKLIEGRMCIGCHEAANYQHPYFDGNKKGIFRDYLFMKFAK